MRATGPVRRVAIATVVATGLVVLAVGLGPTSGAPAPVTVGASRATCGPGSLPETDLQGRVPLRDRTSGRSLRGYRCNLELVGRYRGEGSSWVSQSYRDCAYLSTHLSPEARRPGVQVLDVSRPRRPRLAATLTDPAMLSTWETLRLDPRRGLLAGVTSADPAGQGTGTFAVYDVSGDCRRPRLLASTTATDLGLPVAALGHEAAWSPDGRTYWVASGVGGLVTAIDVSDPTRPRVVFSGATSTINHGLSLSPDGNRIYVARLGDGSGLPLRQNGVQIFDASSIQRRDPKPRLRLVGEEYWTDGGNGQHALRFVSSGQPYLAFVDEQGLGGVRLIDISDETDPVTVSKIKLAIQLPQHAAQRAEDTENSGFFGYEAHYCTVDRPRDPTYLACGFFQSGVRVFDITSPRHPREVAYFNPPGTTLPNSALPSSDHASGSFVSTGGTTDLAVDYCSSPPRFVGRQLWVACQDNGFLVLRFTNGVGPRPAPSSR